MRVSSATNTHSPLFCIRVGTTRKSETKTVIHTVRSASDNYQVRHHWRESDSKCKTAKVRRRRNSNSDRVASLQSATTAKVFRRRRCICTADIYSNRQVQTNFVAAGVLLASATNIRAFVVFVYKRNIQKHKQRVWQSVSAVAVRVVVGPNTISWFDRQ